MAPRIAYFNATSLAARGWTAAMIRDFLGRPDATAPNPCYVRAAPTLLFLASRVRAAERTIRFQRRLGQAEERSRLGRAAAQRRREEVLRVVRADQIVIPRLAPHVLAARAVRHRHESDVLVSDVRTVERRILDRWKVDYLRRSLADYDSLLEGLFGQIGRVEAERLLRRRLYEAITKAYPDLADECRRQLRAVERS